MAKASWCFYFTIYSSEISPDVLYFFLIFKLIKTRGFFFFCFIVWKTWFLAISWNIEFIRTVSTDTGFWGGLTGQPLRALYSHRDLHDILMKDKLEKDISNQSPFSEKVINADWTWRVSHGLSGQLENIWSSWKEACTYSFPESETTSPKVLEQTWAWRWCRVRAAPCHGLESTAWVSRPGPHFSWDASLGRRQLRFLRVGGGNIRLNF